MDVKRTRRCRSVRYACRVRPRARPGSPRGGETRTPSAAGRERTPHSASRRRSFHTLPTPAQ